MRKLSGLEPSRVFFYFEEIAGIPHGSGNTGEISNYLVQFAIDHQLKYHQDKSGNVIIWKQASKGSENAEPVMLQGHMDMVCEKEMDHEIDMATDPITLVLENGTIHANKTTLGADDGIAVAYMLAILEDTSLAHPPIEAVFTVDEEIGMLGAAALDTSLLSSKRMINADSEEEGVFLISCAGGTMLRVKLPVSKKHCTGRKVKITVSGGMGGHSGEEINKGRANSNRVLGRVLTALSGTGYSLITLSGGLKDNAIPRFSEAEMMMQPETEVEDVLQQVEMIGKKIKNEYFRTDPKILIQAEISEQVETCEAFTKETQDRVLTALRTLPEGIQRMSFDISGLVQTSLNMGILKTETEEVQMVFSVRSSLESEKEELIERIRLLVQALGGSVSLSGDYPAWEYQKESPLRELMVRVYKNQYGNLPKLKAIHAGVECGLFSGKINGLDCISIGPDMKDIHTPNESIDISSIQRTWNLLIETLSEMTR